MIHLQFGTTSSATLTLKEFETLTSPFYYLFVFTERGANNMVKFTVADSTDYSDDKDRCNQFDINPDGKFTTPGMYVYQVYQKSADSTDVEDNDVLLETGIAIVKPATGEETTEYDAGNQMKIHHNE